MPHESVSADKVTVLPGKGDERVTLGKVKTSLRGFDCLPFHTVLRGELIELCFDDCSILGVGEKG